MFLFLLVQVFQQQLVLGKNNSDLSDASKSLRPHIVYHDTVYQRYIEGKKES